MVSIPTTVPTAVMTHLGARTPAIVPVMATALDHDGLGARDRRQCHDKRTKGRNNKTKLLPLILLKIERG